MLIHTNSVRYSALHDVTLTKMFVTMCVGTESS